MSTLEEQLKQLPQMPQLKTTGVKYDEGKLRYDLIPPEALREITKVLTFGAKKYSQTRLSNLCNVLDVTNLKFYIAGTCVVDVTKNSLGQPILNTPNASEPIPDAGPKQIKNESVTWLDVESKIQSFDKGMLKPNGATDLKPWGLRNSSTPSLYPQDVKSAEVRSFYTWTITIGRGSSEAYFVANTTMVWDFLEILLKDLRPHLPISSLNPSTGDRNWELGISYSRVFGALMRHLWLWFSNAGPDKETGFSHLAHAGCCIFFLLTYEQRKMDSFDDRPKGVAND